MRLTLIRFCEVHVYPRHIKRHYMRNPGTGVNLNLHMSYMYLTDLARHKKAT